MRHPRLLYCATAWAILSLQPRARAEDGLGTQREIGDIIPFHHVSTVAAKADNWGVLPELGYSPDQSLNGGVKFTGRDLTGRDLTGRGLTLDGEVTAAMEKQLGIDGTVLAPRLLNRQAVALGEYHYYLSPDKYFFGLGNNHLKSPISVHSFQRQRALATLAFHAAPDLLFAASAGIRQTRVAGSGEAGPSLPSTSAEFPSLVGIQGGKTNPVIASVVFNNRESVTRPMRGWSVIGSLEHVNRNLGNDFHFTRLTLDAGYLHPVFSPDRILGLHASGEIVSGRSRSIPFFELASLGGADDMRGFFPDRFLGREKFVANSEYRAKLAGFNFMRLWDVQIDGVLFFDGGRVFITGVQTSREFRAFSTSLPHLFDEFRYSYGTGLRVALGEALVARIDAGFSNEQNGLVYLVFGQTF